MVESGKFQGKSAYVFPLIGICFVDSQPRGVLRLMSGSQMKWILFEANQLKLKYLADFKLVHSKGQLEQSHNLPAAFILSLASNSTHSQPLIDSVKVGVNPCLFNPGSIESDIIFSTKSNL